MQRGIMKIREFLFAPFQKWIKNLKTVFALRKEAVSSKWNIEGEIDSDDIAQAVLIVALSLVIAFGIFFLQLTSDDPTFAQSRWRAIAQFLATPVQVTATGMLMACFFFVGSYFHKVPKHFSVAFKATLTVMAIHPLLGFFMYWKLGTIFPLIVYGYFVPKVAMKCYDIPPRNAWIFFGAIYFMLTLIQLQALFRG